MKTIHSLSGMRRMQNNKSLLGAVLLALVLAYPVPTIAGVNVDVSISLPPPIVFAAPPALIVLPETYVYVVPDVEMDIFFYNGWWWRPWEGRWYRSHYYNSGWAYYQSVPPFYSAVPSGWRHDYREHRWKGHQWNYQPIPHEQVQKNWRGWEKNKHWEKQQTWGVQGLKPRTQSQQPSREVQPKSQARPQDREAGKQQSRPQSREVQQQHAQPQYREKAPQSREAAQPQYREAGHESQKGQSQSQKEQKPKHSQQQEGSRDGHEGGEGDRQDRR